MFRQNIKKLSLFSQTLFKNRFCVIDKYQPGYEPLIFSDAKANYEISKLKNGVTVLTESQIFPSHSDIGVLINVGTRDENQQTSGVLACFKENYLRTQDSPDGLKNLEILHTAGSQLLFNIDQEITYLQTSFIPDYSSQIIELTLKCALEQRAELFEYPSAQIDHIPSESLDQYEFNDHILLTAYGLGGLGLPVTGLQSNLLHLNAEKMQQFITENFSYDKVFICGGAVQNHNDFVLQLEEKLNNINILPSTSSTREQSVYLGGENKIVDENQELQVGLFFQSEEWSGENIAAFNILTTILGNSQSFSTGGPGKGMHSRTTKNMLNRHHFIYSAGVVNMHFKDNGIFGLQCSGPYNSGHKILREIIKELKKLTQPFDSVELNRGKNILKSNIFQILERKQDRLDEAIKNYQKLCILGNLEFPYYEEQIDKVTSEDLNKLVKKLFKGKPTYIVKGLNADQMPSFDSIQKVVQQELAK